MEATVKLPLCMAYRKYLEEASLKFNKTVDECRNLYGKYTTKQWDDLLNN